MPTAALSYHEPGIVTILVQASFLLLLNIVNWVLDNAIYCGLLGQVFVGVAWGTPGAQWLSSEVQDTVMQLGYLGLILIVYEGGLSTSFASLWSNLYLSGTVALIGISAPIGLSFILQRLVNATPVQAFAAGAALCSTSLGTTFTILSTSGLDKSRLGVILSSAAMLDDVAGLVMVKVISNLGSSASAFSATTVVRPVFVSIAFAAIIPFTCRLLIQPLTKFLWIRISKVEKLGRHFARPPVAFVAHTLLLVALITGSTYAGTSNLFAAYIAGAVVTWWDALVLSVSQDNVTKDFKNEPAANTSQLQESIVEESSSTSQRTDVAHPTEQAQTLHEPSSVPPALQPEGEYNTISGVAIYDKFYAPAVNFILKPFFFASIGFAIPIIQMFHGAIFWRGMVYTILMILGKVVCGLVLVRFKSLPSFNLRSSFLRNNRKENKKGTKAPDQPDIGERPAQPTCQDLNSAKDRSTHPTEQSQTNQANTSPKHRCNLPKPQSLYPAAMLGSAMVARGEIGFLISSLAESTGVFGAGSSSLGGSSEIFLVVTWAILLCTVIGPVSVGVMVKRVRRLQKREREKGKESGRPDPLGIWGVM